MKLEELKAIAAKRTNGKWSSAYHNRTESWAITHEQAGYDQVNDSENIIAAAPDGSTYYAEDFDFIAACANNIDKLIAIAEAAGNIHCHKMSTGGACTMGGFKALEDAWKAFENESRCI